MVVAYRVHSPLFVVIVCFSDLELGKNCEAIALSVMRIAHRWSDLRMSSTIGTAAYWKTERSESARRRR
jgi:hypothetical protein